jgi:hypothetical protein
MKLNLKWFNSYLINLMISGLLFGEKQAHFSKFHFILKGDMIYFENLEVCFN